MVPRNPWVQAGHAVSPINGLAHEIHLPHNLWAPGLRDLDDS
jgi:hypothetical protein